MRLHRTALVDRKARFAEDVEIGPFCVVGPEVEIGPGTRLLARVTITGRVRIGPGNLFHPTSSVGGPPQDHQPAAPDARIEIGDGNEFESAVTVHLPKMTDSVTRIGSRCRFRYASHVGHDAVVGDGAILDRYAVLGGHSAVEDGAFVGPRSGTHQFATVGRRSFVGPLVPITEDVPPYMEAIGNHFRVVGVNRRLDLPPATREALEKAFRTVWDAGLPRSEAAMILGSSAAPEVREIAAFLRRQAAGRMGRAREALRANS